MMLKEKTRDNGLYAEQEKPINLKRRKCYVYHNDCFYAGSLNRGFAFRCEY